MVIEILSLAAALEWIALGALVFSAAQHETPHGHTA